MSMVRHFNIIGIVWWGMGTIKRSQRIANRDDEHPQCDLRFVFVCLAEILLVPGRWHDILRPEKMKCWCDLHIMSSLMPVKFCPRGVACLSENNIKNDNTSCSGWTTRRSGSSSPRSSAEMINGFVEILSFSLARLVVLVLSSVLGAFCSRPNGETLLLTECVNLSPESVNHCNWRYLMDWRMLSLLTHHSQWIRLQSVYKINFLLFPRPLLIWICWFIRGNCFLSLCKLYCLCQRIPTPPESSSSVGGWMSFLCSLDWLNSTSSSCSATLSVSALIPSCICSD